MTNTETLTARPVRVHVAEVVPSRYKDDVDEWITPSMTDDVTKISLKARHQSNRECTWTIGFIGPDGSARREYQGPILPGPYAYMFPDSVCISAVRMPGDAVRLEHMVEGDYVSIRGYLFRIDDSRGRAGYNPRLVLVTD